MRSSKTLGNSPSGGLAAPQELGLSCSVLPQDKTFSVRGQNMRKLIGYLFASLVLFGFAATASLAYAYPIAAAVVCPSCYGMEYDGRRIVVDAAMPAQMRAELLGDAEIAASEVGAFYGAFSRQPYLVACSTEACDHRMGGRGAKAITLSTPFVTVLRLSPRGIDPTILTHEFSHVELHHRVGLWARLTGAFPAWFDEGIAVLVSADQRYIRSAPTASERCVRDSERPLPTTPFEWTSKVGKDSMLYADAVCRVLRWMDANGGRDGLLRAIDAAGDGTAFNPDQALRGRGLS